MVPLRLHLRNFLSYRGSVTIDFSDLALACLSGDNGAGKSALLDAMTWAIWGESRAQRDVELISLGETDVEVTFEFRMGVREYRVMRRRTQTRPTLEFDARSPGTDNWLPIGGDAVRDTQARIIQEIRLDYDTFANSAFLRQGQADLFTQNKPTERKRILAEILDLSGYDRLADEARTERRTRRARLDEIQTQLGRIDLQLAGRHEKEVLLAELDEEVASAEKRLGEIRSTIDALRDRISSAEMAETLLERAMGRIERLKQQAADVAEQRSRVQKQLSNLKETVARENEIVEAVKARRKWRKKAEEFATALAARQPMLARRQALEREIAQEHANLERHLALLKQSCEAGRQQLSQFEQKGGEAKKLEASLAEHQAHLKRLPEVSELLDTLQQEMNDLTAENASLRARMNEIQKRINGLDEGDTTCPICRRPLEAGEHTHIHEEWTQEGRRLGDEFRANKSRIDKLKVQVAAARKELVELNEIGRTSAGVEARLKQLKSELEDRKRVANQLDDAVKDMSATENLISSGAFMTGQRQELGQIEQHLSQLPYDEEAHSIAHRNSEGLEQAEKEYQILERAKSDIDMHEKQITEFGARLTEIAAELDEAQKDADSLRKSLEGIEEVRRQHQEAVTKHKKLSATAAEMERNRGSLRRQLDELNELEREHARLREESTGLAAEADAFNELMTAFGRNGIQAMVIENVLPELEEEANRILERMTSKQLEVRFRTTREAISSDNTIETLDIIIRDEYGTRPYQMFSGGEAFRINFAIRVALSKLLARRAGASVDTLIVDEGFGTQDQQGRDGLIEALQSVTRDFELVLVITHVDELRYQFPNRIEVVKTESGSRATLV
ncbi:hypothetical protein BH23CHL2_BH23CHL2_29490 [soil metagenome]